MSEPTEGLDKSYTVSEEIGQGRTVTDEEFFDFVADDRQFISELRWQELEAILATEPWTEEVRKGREDWMAAKANAEKNPKAVSDEDWAILLRRAALHRYR